MKPYAASYYPHIEENDEAFNVQGFTDTGTKNNVSKRVVIKIGPEIFHHYYIFDFRLPYNGMIGIDFFEKFGGIIDVSKKELLLSYHKFKLNLYYEDICANNSVNVLIPARTVQIVELLTHSSSILEGVCPEKLIKSNVKIPNSLVKVKNGRFITTIANVSDREEVVNIPPLQIEPVPKIEISNKAMVNTFSSEDRERQILSELRLDHLNLEERIKLENLCLRYKDIFYIKGDQLSFTN